MLQPCRAFLVVVHMQCWGNLLLPGQGRCCIQPAFPTTPAHKLWKAMGPQAFLRRVHGQRRIVTLSRPCFSLFHPELPLASPMMRRKAPGMFETVRPGYLQPPPRNNVGRFACMLPLGRSHELSTARLIWGVRMSGATMSHKPAFI